ncbi:MAG: molybdopterin cofactor-binding domain-containing protein, partial [Casimicrobiaceae bacterium]
MAISRREFVKIVTSSGIALSFTKLATAEPPTFTARETLPGRQGWNPAATGAGRVDGVAKVIGAKLYASDFRAADLPGWPATTSHAILVRAPDATHVYAGMDLARLSGAAKPLAIVTAADLKRVGTRVPDFYKEGDLFCPAGSTPLYLGQPVALLIFETFDAYDQARLLLRDGTFIRFGAQTGPVKMAPYGSHRFVRVAGASPDVADVFSPLQAGWAKPVSFGPGYVPVWAPGNRDGNADAQASYYGDRIRAELAAPNPDLLMIDREFVTQSIDPMFLEPECGIGWYDPGRKILEQVVGVQSPGEAAESVAFLLGKAQGSYKPARINTHIAYIGGGFGGRDHTTFPLYVALAALFYPGHAVRVAHDRFQQFQGGIKRHAFRIHSRIGVHRTTGKIMLFAADHMLDGGGVANLSGTVADVGATAAIGIYDIPKVDIGTVAYHSRGVVAGSMRGYGTLQTMTALETLIDEAATSLRLDPIEFRRRNALRTDGRNMTGNMYVGAVRTPEILDKLAQHAIWTQRAAEKTRGQQQPGILVGTGVACVTKDFGSGADATLSTIEIGPDGRISIHSDAVEMGTAVGTAIANRAAIHIGGFADEVAVAEVDTFGALALVTSGDPYAMDQPTQDALSRNPRWVPQISTPSSGSIGAAVSTHGAAEAARVIFRFGLWPAALDLWEIPQNDVRSAQWDLAKWKDGQLTVPGMLPLKLAAIAARAHEKRYVTGAMTHGFSRWAWSQATFMVGSAPWTAEIDALAIRMGGGKFVRLTRSNLKMPPVVYNRFGPLDEWRDPLQGPAVKQVLGGTEILQTTNAWRTAA